MDKDALTPEQINEAIRDRYVPVMAPAFFPENPTTPDIIQLFASLLRVGGMEDGGWDPHQESRAVLDDLYSLMQSDLADESIKDRNRTEWRLGLIFYSHVVEMSPPYDVLTNLLRFRLGKGYSPNPFYDFLSTEERKRFRKSGIFPKKKIEIIKNLSTQAGLGLGGLFDEFYFSDFRNAISHSDFILTDEGFRSRNENGIGAFQLTYEQVDDRITKAKVFFGTFFGLEREARRGWGQHSEKGIAYDPELKGIMEILVDDQKLMNGFKVHWPNGSESRYRRTENEVEMTNCSLAIEHSTVSLYVGLLAQNPGAFSPLVESGTEPNYTPLVNGSIPVWEP